MPITWLSLSQSTSSTLSLSLWGIPMGITQTRSQEVPDMLHTVSKAEIRVSTTSQFPSQLSNHRQRPHRKGAVRAQGRRHQVIASMDLDLVRGPHILSPQRLTRSPSNSTIRHCICGSSSTKSTQPPPAASYPTQTLLTQTVASGRSASPSIARGTTSSHGALLNFRAVSPPVLHSAVIRWCSWC